MKKILLVFAMFISALTFAQTQLLSFNELPATAQQFISKNFDANAITHVVMEKEFLSNDYKVLMNDGTKLEFNDKGIWKEVEAEYSAVPAQLIPDAIKKYINTKFPNASVVKLETKRYGYAVELKSGLELEFDKNGKFLRIDD